MAAHSSILAWETPWTEESGGLQSVELWVWCDLATKHTEGVSTLRVPPRGWPVPTFLILPLGCFQGPLDLFWHLCWAPLDNLLALGFVFDLWDLHSPPEATPASRPEGRWPGRLAENSIADTLRMRNPYLTYITHSTTQAGHSLPSESPQTWKTPERVLGTLLLSLSTFHPLASSW